MINKQAIIPLLLFLTPLLVSAADVGSFQEFYAPDKSWGWGTWTFLIGAVIFTTGLALFTAGAAAPAGAATISGILGLSGTAGIIVGAVIIAGATELTLQLGIDEIKAHFSNSQFKEDSKKMITLPPMRNPSGGEKSKAVFKIFSNLNQNLAYDSLNNSKILDQALSILENSNSVGKSKYKENLIRAVILFQKGEYLLANDLSGKLIIEAQSNSYSPSMLYFISATSQFYQDEIDIQSSILALKKSILAEPKNPYYALMYGIYLDRFTYLLDKGKLSSSVYYNLIDTVFSISEEKARATILYIIYARTVGLMEKLHKEINFITSDPTFRTMKSETILWKKYFLKSELEKIADHIDFEFKKLKADKEIIVGMEEYRVRLKSLEKSKDFLTMVKYSLSRHYVAFILLLSALLLLILYFFRRRRREGHGEVV